MRKLLLTIVLFLIYVLGIYAQVGNINNQIEVTVIANGDSVRISRLNTPNNVRSFQVIIQNEHNLTDSRYWWVTSGDGVFPLDYCNARITTTALLNTGEGITGNVVRIKRVSFNVNVSTISNMYRSIHVNVDGGDYFTMSIYGTQTRNPYVFFVNRQQVTNTSEQLPMGIYKVFIPNVFGRLHYAVITVYNSNCKARYSQLFYMR